MIREKRWGSWGEENGSEDDTWVERLQYGEAIRGWEAASTARKYSIIFHTSFLRAHIMLRVENIYCIAA